MKYQMDLSEECYRERRNKQIDVVLMNIAMEIASLSHAIKAKVGALIVDSDKNIISCGFNGTPAGFDNIAEYTLPDGTLKTKPETLHAESNAIAKIAKSTQSSKDAIMYITLSPCMNCAKLISNAGIREVIYKNEHDDVTGLDLLRKCGITVRKCETNHKDQHKMENTEL